MIKMFQILSQDFLLNYIFKVEGSITFIVHYLTMPDSKTPLAYFINNIIFELSIYQYNISFWVVLSME